MTILLYPETYVLCIFIHIIQWFLTMTTHQNHVYETYKKWHVQVYLNSNPYVTFPMPYSLWLLFSIRIHFIYKFTSYLTYSPSPTFTFCGLLRQQREEPQFIYCWVAPMLYVPRNSDAQINAFLFPTWLYFLIPFFPLSICLTNIYWILFTNVLNNQFKEVVWRRVTPPS